ncbi:hypothetical protein RJ641_008860 [Dillenia turbinata]|uniref:Uncharacterized protein n=1 Tax=Dillenia turbinata TaxID=194707 RepID=A0AAN8VBQ7_9MAGN
MNVSVTSSDFMEGNTGDGSDSDTNSSDSPPEYYQPISVADDHDDGDHVLDRTNSDESDGGDGAADDIYGLSNGYACGISSLDLSSDEEDSEEEAEERMREASVMAVVRAFREDERRRNAPLTADNATRVMEAMRGVSFGGPVPDWVNSVPEDRWMDQLRRLRRPASQSSSSTASIRN